MTREEDIEGFLRRIRRAPRLKHNHGLIDSKYGVIPVTSQEIRTPKCLWYYHAPPWIWKLPRREVVLADLKTGQRHLAPSKLEAMLKERDLDKLRSGVLICLDREGQLYVWDGNHRANVLKLLGDRTTVAHVLQEDWE